MSPYLDEGCDVLSGIVTLEAARQNGSETFSWSTLQTWTLVHHHHWQDGGWDMMKMQREACCHHDAVDGGVGPADDVFVDLKWVGGDAGLHIGHSKEDIDVGAFPYLLLEGAAERVDGQHRSYLQNDEAVWG